MKHVKPCVQLKALGDFLIEVIGVEINDLAKAVAVDLVLGQPILSTLYTVFDLAKPSALPS